MAHLPIEAPPSAGNNVDGFRLEQLLADGRYARVFRAVDSQSGSDVVVKFPKPAVLAEPAMREAFVREALTSIGVARCGPRERARPEERRVGKEGVRSGRSQWAPTPSKKKSRK